MNFVKVYENSCTVDGQPIVPVNCKDLVSQIVYTNNLSELASNDPNSEGTSLFQLSHNSDYSLIVFQIANTSSVPKNMINGQGDPELSSDGKSILEDFVLDQIVSSIVFPS